ncbi:hypothetical protein [Streptomyces sp. NPDC089919]|uniref:hypothetical protein n=1 Tax=Streptomyces sp. NPDC089919 TaxID=3155188 RepID=UPI00341DD9B9
MRAIRSTSATLFAAGVAGAVLSLVAPAATAQTSPPVAPFAFRVLPSTITPGGQVTLSVPGCNASFATASSGVFDAVSIPRGRSVTVTVDRDARRGAVYSVTFTCPGEVSAQAQNSSADLTIAGGCRARSPRPRWHRSAP